MSFTLLAQYTDISSALFTAKILAASIALQFIFWLVAQCTAAPAKSTQTVVIVAQAPQQYAPVTSLHLLCL